MEKIDLKLESVDTQMKIFKWLIGGVALAGLTVSSSLGTWIYAQGTTVAKLSEGVATHEKRLDKQEIAQKETDTKVGIITGDVKVVHADVRHIKDSVKDIHDLVKVLVKK